MTGEESKDPIGAEPEALFAAWALRVEMGEELEFEELLREHSSFVEELTRLHEDWLLFAPILGRVVPGLIASGSGIVMPSLTGGPDADDEQPSAELLARLGIHTPNEGRYRFRAVIGRGGGGVVLKVWDTKLNRPLAMKVVLGRGEDRPSGDTPQVDGRTLSRFVDEARIASQLNHPGIVPVHELGADDSGRAFFTMKLVKGDDLSRIFEKVKTGEDGWSQARALDVLLRVCEAMAYAHDRGVMHRDLKPANIMVGSYGEVHVMDWGLARVIGAPDSKGPTQRKAGESVIDSIRHSDREATPGSLLLTAAGSVLGTPSYMSPEQAKGELETLLPASDVYSVGAMLYQLLSGEVPYVRHDEAMNVHMVWQAVLHGPPTPLEEFKDRTPVELVAICQKTMSRNVQDRYSSMVDLAQDMRAFSDGRVVAAFEAGAWAESRKWVKRNKPFAAALMGIVVALVCGLGASWILLNRADQSAILAAQNAELMKEQAEIASLEAQAARSARRVAESAQREAENANRDAERARDAAEASAHLAKERLRAEEAYALKAQESERVAQLAREEAEAALRAEEQARLEANNAKANAREQLYLSSILGAEAARRNGEYANVRKFLDRAPQEFRNWEWGHIDSISDVSRVRLLGHANWVNSAKFSPDSSTVVTASDDGTARIWSTVAGVELVRMSGHSGAVTSASFSPDGRTVLTSSLDGSVRLWDARSGAERLRLQRESPTAFVQAAFSPDGFRIATASRSGFSVVWDSLTGAEITTIEDDVHGANSVCFSPDGNRLVTSSNYGTATVCDSRTGAKLLELRVDLGRGRGRVASAAFTSDGTKILTATVDGVVRLWSSSTGEMAKVLSMGKRQVANACASPGGARVVVACHDGVAYVWSGNLATELASLTGHSGRILNSSFGADGELLVTASSDHSVRVWNVSNFLSPSVLKGGAGTVSRVRSGYIGNTRVRAHG